MTLLIAESSKCFRVCFFVTIVLNMQTKLMGYVFEIVFWIHTFKVETIRTTLLSQLHGKENLQVLTNISLYFGNDAT